MSYQEFLAAADTTNIKAGGTSFFDDPLMGIGATAAGAVVSGLGSIWNTGVDVSNKVFGTNAERLNTKTVLNGIDSRWGAYYDENKELIDTLGFIGTSFIPGGLAVKGLKMARAGESAGAFSKVLGFASSRQDAALQSALRQVATEGGTVFSRLNEAKMASMAWGAADQVLQTFAFETAVATTMKASPLLDEASFKDLAWDVVKTSMVGGLIGGGVEALFTNNTIRSASKLVDSKKREYDVLREVGKSNLGIGDKAFAILDAAADLPKEIFDTQIPFKAAKGGFLDTARLFEKSRDATMDAALLKFEKALTTSVEGDYSVGTPVAKALLGVWKEGVQMKLPDSELRSKLGDFLFNLERIEPVGKRVVNLEEDVLYLSKAASVKDPLTNWMSPAKQATTDVPYRVIGNLEEATGGALGEKGLVHFADAWKAGLDYVIDPVSGQVKISPFSKVFQQLTDAEANFTSTYFNTLTRTTSKTVIPTIADVAEFGQKPLIAANTVAAGNHSYTFNIHHYEVPAQSIEATARNLWADSLHSISGNVDGKDMAVLDKILQSPTAVQGEIRIHVQGKGAVKYQDIAKYDQWLLQHKINRAQEILLEADGKGNLFEQAYQLNVTPQWLEAAIATKFNPVELYKMDGWSRPLAQYGERENVIFRYNTKGLENARMNAEGIIAFKQRVVEAQQKARDAADVVLGDHKGLFLDWFESMAKRADGTGVGATTIAAGDADYADKARLWALSTGKATNTAAKERAQRSLETMQGHSYRMLQDPESAADLVAITTKVRTSTDAWSIFFDAEKNTWALVDTASYKKMLAGKFESWQSYMRVKEDTGEFLNQHHELHKKRVHQQKVLASAQGTAIDWDLDRLYVPPVDTRRVPFFAFVRQHDGTMFGSSEVGMITAKSSDELTRLAQQVEKETGLKVIYKKDTEEWFKAKGDYDFQRVMNTPQINSFLQSKKLLGDYLPSFLPQDVVEDYITYISRQETKLVRDAVALRYGQTFAEFENLSKATTAAQTSKMEGWSKLMTRNVADPFGDYTRTALDISKRGEFTILHSANEFVDALGTRAYQAVEGSLIAAKGGKITWEEANATLKKFGMGAHFKEEEMFNAAQVGADRNIIKTAVNKANMLLANGLLRLDFANSLMNIVSTPILLGTEVAAIRRSIKNDPALFASFNDMLSLQVPGEGFKVPNTAKLLYNAIHNMFGEGGQTLRGRYYKIAAIKNQRDLFHDMVDDISLLPGLAPTEWAKKVDKWVEVGAKWTGNTRAEEITRFVSADVMRQITDPLVAKKAMSLKEQDAFINIFVNRVHGNYVASQRPILFQGTLGSAIGLFQTYQFNLFQQLFRHIENRDLKTIAVMGGLQGTLFGLNGLPMFDAINTQIVGGASINAGHKDAYSFAVNSFGKEVGDWLLYGTASAAPGLSGNMPALYTRGDLNPRSAFIVPVNPADVPAVSATIKVAQTLKGMTERLANGGDVLGSMLYGLEHNGINRPLAGLTQALSGRATTGKGELISASSDLASIATFSRLMGSKPMDESIGLNTIFRQRAYQAMDKDRIEVLGAVIKEKMRGNKPLTEDDWVEFQGKYVAAGGNIHEYSQALQRWSKGANSSLINEAMRHHQRASGQRLIEAMGGNRITDYRDISLYEE